MQFRAIKLIFYEDNVMSLPTKFEKSLSIKGTTFEYILSSCIASEYHEERARL